MDERFSEFSDPMGVYHTLRRRADGMLWCDCGTECLFAKNAPAGFARPVVTTQNQVADPGITIDRQMEEFRRENEVERKRIENERQSDLARLERRREVQYIAKLESDETLRQLYERGVISLNAYREGVGLPAMPELEPPAPEKRDVPLMERNQKRKIELE